MGVEEGMKSLVAARRINAFTLLTSSSTLICCALPATLVGIGAVATLTSLVTAFPQLIWISEHKVIVFGLAGSMLLLAGVIQWRTRKLPCPTDPYSARQCEKTRKQSLWVYWGSLGLFLIGCFFAFIAPIFM